MKATDLERFRTLFAQEAEARLARVSQLLLRLEHDGEHPATLDELFREVHTLKGGAAVVELSTLSAFAHGLEERLAGLRRGGALDPSTVDELLAAADVLAQLVAASVEGRPPDELAAIAASPPSPPSPPPPQAAPPSPPPAAHRESPTSADGPGDAAAPVAATSSTAGADRADRADPPATPSRRAPASRGSIMVPVERLEELVRLVGEAASAELRVERLVHERLGAQAGRVSELAELSRLLNELQDKAMRTQMVPVATVTDHMHRAVRDLARTLGKEVRWEVEGEQTELERSMLHQLSDALLHVVRNAVDHGIEAPDERVRAGKPAYGTVRLHAAQLGSEVIISVSDDGRGIDVAAVREVAARQGVETEELSDVEVLQLVFRSGLSTARFLSSVSGRGVGLDVVHASLDAARGRVEVRSTPGVGTVLRLVVPITLAVLPCLLVETAGQRFAVPMHRVVVAREADVPTAVGEGRPFVWHDGEPVPVTSLAEVLGRPVAPSRPGPVIVVSGTLTQHAFQVDALLGHGDVVVKGLSAVLPVLDAVAGTSIEPDGSVLVVLDPPGLVEHARHPRVPVAAARPAERPAGPSPHVLVVDDALTVRELQRSILERAGFRVSVAVDGVDALARLAGSDIELVLTDVQMPRMDGFGLTRAIRAHPDLKNLPVLIITTLDSAEHRREGLEAGADGYIVKASFDERSLLEAVHRVLGEAP